MELKIFIERSDLGRTFLLLSSQLLCNIGQSGKGDHVNFHCGVSLVRLQIVLGT